MVDVDLQQNIENLNQKIKNISQLENITKAYPMVPIVDRSLTVKAHRSVICTVSLLHSSFLSKEAAPATTR
jgi:hypothetical protein